MASKLTIANRALQAMGTRTNMAQNELDNSTSNEAIQVNLVFQALQDELTRMAPWNFARKFANLTYITSAPGTPENPSSSGFSSWQPGLPAPPWAYEYQYPADCLRALWIIPQFATGFGGGVPITAAVTGGVPSFWNGPPVKFMVGNDQFFSATGVTVAAAGLGYAVGDVITLATPSSGLGAPAQVLVTSIGGGGAITGVSLVTDIMDETIAGSYFTVPTNPVAQGSTTGVGTGATFNLTYATTPPVQGDQRVILTNQENATLAYLKRVTDLNVCDVSFQEALVQALAGRLVFQLTGDKGLANLKLNMANNIVMEARKADGNEALTVNDVTPDWLRARGIAYPTWEFSPNIQFDWGPMFTPYG